MAAADVVPVPLPVESSDSLQNEVKLFGRWGFDDVTVSKIFFSSFFLRLSVKLGLIFLILIFFAVIYLVISYYYLYVFG